MKPKVNVNIKTTSQGFEIAIVAVKDSTILLQLCLFLIGWSGLSFLLMWVLWNEAGDVQFFADVWQIVVLLIGALLYGIVYSLAWIVSLFEREYLAITGPSGSGKSTLMHIISTLDKPTSGIIRINGQDVSKIKRLNYLRAQTIGFIFQLHNLIPSLSLVDNVMIPLAPLNIPIKEKRERAAEQRRAAAGRAIGGADMFRRPGGGFGVGSVQSEARGCGGTGRRAGFRCLWGQPRGGSNPLIRSK